MKEKKFKLNRTIYMDEDAGDCSDINYIINGKNEYPILAKKGQIFEIKELNNKIREEYSIYDEIYKFIAISYGKLYPYIFFQKDDKNLLEWFEKVEE
jgi:hypothetical protein